MLLLMYALSLLGSHIMSKASSADLHKTEPVLAHTPDQTSETRHQPKSTPRGTEVKVMLAV